MSLITKFHQDRWSLYVRFDSRDVQLPRTWMAGASNPCGDELALRDFILGEVCGATREEYPEIVRSLPGDVIEITSPIVDWLLLVFNWIVENTIPAEIRLVRNEE